MGLTGRRGVRVTTALLLLAAAWSIPASGGAQDSDPCSASDIQPIEDEITLPSDEYRSVQAAICGLVDGGTVHLRPGSYPGPVVIWGKHARIVGEGNAKVWPAIHLPRPVNLVEPDLAVGVITVGGGGSLKLEKTRIIGGDAGILNVETAGSVEIKQAAFEGNGRGVLHLSAGNLTLKHTSITETVGNAISLAPVNLKSRTADSST